MQDIVSKYYLKNILSKILRKTFLKNSLNVHVEATLNNKNVIQSILKRHHMTDIYAFTTLSIWNILNKILLQPRKKVSRSNWILIKTPWPNSIVTYSVVNFHTLWYLACYKELLYSRIMTWNYLIISRRIWLDLVADW